MLLRCALAAAYDACRRREAALAEALRAVEAESTNAAANIFVGQTEAPLVIRPYVAGLSRSGLFAV